MTRILHSQGSRGLNVTYVFSFAIIIGAVFLTCTSNAVQMDAITSHQSGARIPSDGTRSEILMRLLRGVVLII